MKIEVNTDFDELFMEIMTAQHENKGNIQTTRTQQRKQKPAAGAYLAKGSGKGGADEDFKR